MRRAVVLGVLVLGASITALLLRSGLSDAVGGTARSPVQDASTSESEPSVALEPAISVERRPVPDVGQAVEDPVDVSERPALEVLVLDDLGQPVARVTVGLWPATARTRSEPLLETPTDGDGRARAKGLGPGTYRVALPTWGASDGSGHDCDRGRPPLLPVGNSAEVRWTAQGPVPPELTLTGVRAGRVEGVVSGLGGLPADAVVQLRPVAGGPGRFARTDPSSGAYCLFVEPGRYRCDAAARRVTDERQPPNPLEGRTAPLQGCIEVAPEGVHRLDLGFPTAGATVEGVVVDQEGVPWEGLTVMLFESEREGCFEGGTQFTATFAERATDASGAFHFEHVPPGPHRLAFSAPSMSLAEVQVGPGGFGEYPGTLDAAVPPGAARVDLGTLIVHRYATQRVEGVVRVLGRPAAVGDGVVLHATLPPANPGADPRRRPIELGDEGRFAFELSLHRPWTLTLEAKSASGDRVVQEALSRPTERPVFLILDLN